MAEDTVFSDDTVSVTTARVVISGTTYALRNITSVKMSETSTPAVPAKTGCPLALIGCGGLLALGALAGLAAKQLEVGFGNLVIGGAIICGGVMWMRSAKPTPATTDYHVTIASSSGEAHALTSKDKSYIEKVVVSINDAIVMAK